MISYYAGGGFGNPVTPAFRRAAERGEIEVWECEEGLLCAGLQAAAQSLPFLPWRGGVGTSLPEVNPDLKVFKDPINGETLIAVPPIKPDVTILHAAHADAFGNVQHLGGPGWIDLFMYRAAERTIVQVEKIISNEEVRADAWKTTIAAADAIVRAPFGAHPSTRAATTCRTTIICASTTTPRTRRRAATLTPWLSTSNITAAASATTSNSSASNGSLPCMSTDLLRRHDPLGTAAKDWAGILAKLSFASWIVYGLLSANGRWLSAGLAGVAITGVIVATQYRRRAVKLMDCTSLGYFTAETLTVFVSGTAFIQRDHLALVWGVFAVVAWLTVIAGFSSHCSTRASRCRAKSGIVPPSFK